MNAAVAQERWQGQVIDGKYALRDWIGGSASTAVFRTELPGKSEQPVAIKLVRADFGNPAQQVLRWKESAQLSGPNLLQIFDSGACRITGAQWVYCVMEYAEEHLDQVLPTRPLALAEVGELLPPVLDGLAFLHARGLVHSRLKPSNIFAIKNRVKLSFDNVRSAGNGIQVNTPGAYDPPEAESGKLTTAADIWSLGMTLAAALDQRPVVWNRTTAVIPAVPKSVPSPYRLIVRECLRINPEERCSIDRIRELLHIQTQAPTSIQALKPKTSKVKLAAPVSALLVLSAIVFGVISLRHHSETALAPTTATVTKPSDEPTIAQPASTAPGSNTRAGSNAYVMAGIVERVLPQVPRSARLTIHGKVRVKVRVTVGSNGEVSSATLSSAGPSRYFARLALEASQKWKFTPAEGLRGTQWLLEYKFGRNSTEVNPFELH